jgi:hypothetical protein
MTHVVCAVLAEHRGVLLVHAQCGYMLSCDSLVSGARRVLVRGGDVLNSGMVQHIEYNARGISARDTKTVQQVIVQEPKLRAVDIGVRHKSSAQLLA